MTPFDVRPPQGYLLVVNENCPDEAEYFFSMDFDSIQRYLREWVRLERGLYPRNHIDQADIDSHFEKTGQTYVIIEPVMVE